MSRILKLSDHEQYTLGDNLGRGAFGSVYRGLNIFSGETVAVKQIKLKNLPAAEANDMMTEIDLLKNLNHPNIVKYNCFYKSADSLYIVLEYCENGSLHNICKTFGNFPEHLVAVYTDQVLLGLVYLHEQGVIHRDIKGANILTTKDGKVKLADFGVAISAQSDMNVVGSPYWMAPEIIELAGATSASDIWSLGCTVIELLQGRPPYSEMDSMSALFHIVDDEHPPFPEGSSHAAKDFLMRCFQKDPNLRTSAKKLRKHDWITNHTRHGSHRTQTPIAAVMPGFDDAVTSVKVYNQKVNAPDVDIHAIGKSRKGGESSGPLKTSPTRRKPPQISKHMETGDDDWGKDLEIKLDKGSTRPTFKLKASRSALSSRSKYDVSWDQESDRDNLKRSIIKDNSDKQDHRIRGNEPNGHGKPSKPSHMRRRQSFEKKNLPDELTIRPSSAQLIRSSFMKSSTASPGSAPSTQKLSQSNASQSATGGPLTPRRAQRAQSALAIRSTTGKKTALALQQFVDDQENYDDMLDIGGLSLSSITQKSNSEKNFDKKWNQEDDTAEDPFAEIEEFAKENLSANVMREQKARASHQVEVALEAFQTKTNDEASMLLHLRDIRRLLESHPDVKSVVMSSHGLLPLLETLEITSEDDISLTILEVLNLLTRGDEEVQENIAFVGGLSSVTKFAHRKYSQEIRTQAAIFVRQILASSDLNAQIFVSCRGLSILTEFLEEDCFECRDLVVTGIEGTLRVFQLQGKYTTKNDLCRIMARTGVLEPLTHTLHLLITSTRVEEDEKSLSSIFQIMLNFAQADEYVKGLIATRTLLKRLLMDLPFMEGQHIISCLKFLKSMSCVTSTLEVMHNANAIERLVELLSKTDKPWYQEASNHALAILFNLCRIDKTRQTEAAFVGAIPILKQIIANDRPVKDLAIPMICTMAHNSECRKILWSQGGLDIYLKLLLDTSWRVNAFEAIAVWFLEEPARVERRLTEPSSLTVIIAAFGSARAVSFESLLDQLQKLLKAAKKLSRAICTHDFMTKLIQRLDHPKPTVRANLLKTLQCVLDAHPSRREVFGRYTLDAILGSVAKNDSAVIVRTLADSIRKNVQHNDKQS